MSVPGSRRCWKQIHVPPCRTETIWCSAETPALGAESAADRSIDTPRPDSTELSLTEEFDRFLVTAPVSLVIRQRQAVRSMRDCRQIRIFRSPSCPGSPVHRKTAARARELKQKMLGEMEKLEQSRTETERQVTEILRRFALIGFADRRIDEIARENGVDRSNIWQFHAFLQALIEKTPPQVRAMFGTSDPVNRKPPERK